MRKALSSLRVHLRSIGAIASSVLILGCGKQTEIVVRLDATGTVPASVLVKLHRSTPFGADPGMTPSFVTAALDGADLDLYVAPSASSTRLSLLPAKGAPSDLRITVSAPGFVVMPSEPRDVTFSDGISQELQFTIASPPPDGGVKDGASGDGGAKDGGGKDGGATDGGPKDAAPAGG